MNQVDNFILLSRENPSSTAEKIGDILLMPARVLFQGRHVSILHDHSMRITKQTVGCLSENQMTMVACKIVAFICLPLALVGICVKLICLMDQDYRKFCAQKIPHSEMTENPEVEPADNLLEIQGQAPPLQDSGRPYVGFPNPSKSDCSYQTTAIVCAFTHEKIYHLPLADKEHDRKLAMSDLEHLVKLQADVTKQVEKVNKELKQHRENLEKEPNSKLRESREKIIKTLLKQLEDWIAEGDELALKYQNAKKKLEQAQQEIEQINTRFKRAEEVMQILRGEMEGTLTEEDAQIVCSACNMKESDLNPKLEKNFFCVFKAEKSQIEHRMKQSDWKVLRVKENQHWTVIVRARNDQLVTIDEATVRSGPTLKSLIHKYAKPDTWDRSQFHIYYKINF